MAPTDQPQLIAEITRASRALALVFGADKMNVSALGNIVPQLHHLVARFVGDPSWPDPVRGNHPPIRHEPAALSAILKRIRGALADS